MSQNTGKEIAAIIGALVSLLVAGILVWFVFKKLEITDADVSVFALILLPMLIYMVLSGRVKELKGPGGIEARFAGFAKKAVDPDTKQITESIQEMEQVVKSGPGVLKSRIKDLDPKKPQKPLNLILRLGTYLDGDALKAYVEAVAQFRSFKFVLVVDRAERLVTYAPHWTITKILDNGDQRDEFVRRLNDEKIEELTSLPGVINETLQKNTSNIDALRPMADNRIEALVVVDGSHKPMGMVERDQLVPKLLVSLSQGV